MTDEITTGEVARLLSRIEAKVDKALDDHERRLVRVERIMWTVLGLAIAGGSSGVGAMLSALAN